MKNERNICLLVGLLLTGICLHLHYQDPNHGLEIVIQYIAFICAALYWLTSIFTHPNLNDKIDDAIIRRSEDLTILPLIFWFVISILIAMVTVIVFVKFYGQNCVIYTLLIATGIEFVCSIFSNIYMKKC